MKQIVGTQAHLIRNSLQKLHSLQGDCDVIWRITDEEQTSRGKGEGTPITSHSEMSQTTALTSQLLG